MREEDEEGKRANKNKGRRLVTQTAENGGPVGHTLNRFPFLRYSQADTPFFKLQVSILNPRRNLFQLYFSPRQPFPFLRHFHFLLHHPMQP